MKLQVNRCLIGMIFLLGLPIIACAMPVTTATNSGATSTPQQESLLPFEGLWVSESNDSTQTSQVLAITTHSFYWVRTGNWADVKSLEGKEGGVHEEFYEIISYDLQDNHVTLLKRWIRNDGLFGGFDYPKCLLTYTITGDELRIAIGGESDFPPQATSIAYYRK